MKNTIILPVLIILAVSINSIDAQKFQFGVKGGMVISEIEIMNTVTTHITPDKPAIWMHAFDQKTGFHFSVVMTGSINSRLMAGIEPGYLLKGSRAFFILEMDN